MVCRPRGIRSGPARYRSRRRDTWPGAGRPVRRRLMGFVARGLVATSSGRSRSYSGDRVESGRPTVLVAEHRNGLVDGLVLMATLGRFPRFLGKSTLFHNPLLWPFLKLAGVVPVHRRPGRPVPGRQRRAFARCQQLLARAGEWWRSSRGRQPRSDRPAAAAHRGRPRRPGPWPKRGGGVDTVAVTLVYDDKQRFRSGPWSGWVCPTGPPWMGHRPDRRTCAVRAMTADLAQRIVDRSGAGSMAGAGADGIAEVAARHGPPCRPPVLHWRRRRPGGTGHDPGRRPAGGANGRSRSPTRSTRPDLGPMAAWPMLRWRASLPVGTLRVPIDGRARPRWWWPAVRLVGWCPCRAPLGVGEAGRAVPDNRTRPGHLKLMGRALRSAPWWADLASPGPGGPSYVGAATGPTRGGGPRRRPTSVPGP